MDVFPCFWLGSSPSSFFHPKKGGEDFRNEQSPGLAQVMEYVRFHPTLFTKLMDSYANEEVG